jgi:carboxymethylenebutenolidase
VRNDTLDLRSLQPKAELGRRGFAQAFATTSLAVGFARAVQPVQAQTMITTDTQGLEAGEVKVPVSDGTIPAYRAAPAGSGRLATVLVVSEIFGVHEHIKDVCRRFAKAGYLAVAPELFARQGDPSKYTDMQALIREVVAKAPDAQVMADLDATAAWAAAQGRGDPARLAITGFCWGGRITWLYAAHRPGLKAGVAWYGRLVGDATPNQPKHPLDLVEDLKAPVLGLYGGKDQGIPVDTVELLQEAAKTAGKTVEFVVYPDAPHAFHADYRPSFREGPAKDGWQRCLAWMQRHLAA